MTYGLVYRPIDVHLGSSSSRANVKSDAISPNEKIREFLAPNVSNKTVLTTIVDIGANETDDNWNDRQNTSTIYDNAPFSIQDMPQWTSNNGNILQQYQVYENDSEIEGSSHKIKIHSDHDYKHDGKNKKAAKKKIKGTKYYQFKGKEKGKKGGYEDEEHEDGKHANRKSGYTSYGKTQGKHNKSTYKKKKGEHKLEKKSKKYRKKKGYKDKWNLDKEDKVQEFWKNHREEGEYYVFGLNKKRKHKNENGGKKHKWKKKQKTHRKSSNN